MLIEGVAAIAAPLHVDLQVVLQIRANARQVVDDAEPVRPQMVGRADAREHQELGRAKGAGGKDHLAFGPDNLRRGPRRDTDADGVATLQDQAENQRTGTDREVGPCPRGVEVGVRRVRAHTAIGVAVERPEALLMRSVDILGRGEARLAPGLDEGLVERQCDSVGHGRHGPGPATPGAFATIVRFAPPEIGQHLGVGPAPCALRGPPLVVLRVAPDVGHAVNRRRAA